ncbi:MAG: aminopeptidase P family protein [Candidatus Koribacter versatilis]|uniref:Aminopeptidase P family protein n=1 Tax=Candidatus Korobacter versatilis TaxID=658062 RepID=A0A932EPR1_9BACT|nr:aminopeptidase P family protein [Candidatus Koribacter versatilis]
MDYQARVHKLAERLRGKRGVDALLVTHLPNVRYLCGFTGSAGVLALADGGGHSFATQAALFTDGRYTTQAREEVSGARVVVGKRNPLLEASAWLKQQRARRVGFEAEHMSFATQRHIAAALAKPAKLVPTSGLVERLRMIKEREEIEQIRAAVLLASGLFDRVLRTIRPGVREADVAAELEHAARRDGAEGMSFETIVASGSRSALPHGKASAQPIQANGFVILDFGVILAGYCSDMTRTVCMGSPSKRQAELYAAVLGAQEAAIARVSPGRTVAEVDQAARSRLQKAGLGRYFTHSTGHGVGLEIHEPPRIAKGQAEKLVPGMVITIEPGVYLPGEGGVRIEDMVVVTQSGCEVLTPTTKELIALE